MNDPELLLLLNAEKQSINSKHYYFNNRTRKDLRRSVVIQRTIDGSCFFEREIDGQKKVDTINKGKAFYSSMEKTAPMDTIPIVQKYMN